MNRRNLLTIAPAVLISCGAPANAACSMPMETPVAVLFREWKRLCALYETVPDAEVDAVADRRSEVAWAIYDTKATGAMDLLMKVVVATEWGECGIGDVGHSNPWAEVRALIGA